MLTVNELFSGIGSQRAALERLGIEHEVVGIAEIDKFAIKSYEAIWGDTKNYGDISKVEKLDYADFWTYSFPCQDISVAGKQAGIKHGKTRSGLLYEVERLLEVAQEHDELPKYLMLENVKNLVGKKFKPQFEEWITRLDELGYNTKWQILNAKSYGIPQNRERVFGISIRKDIDTGYVFPEPFELKARLKDILEDEVDEKFYISQEKTEKLISQIKLNNPSIKREPGKADGAYTNQSLSFTRPPLKDLSRTLKAKVHDTAVVMPIDKSYNNPKPIEIANCITAREDRGISNRKSEGTAVIEPILFGGMQKNQAVKTDGISTCLTSSMGTGGGYVPMITEPSINQVGMLDIKGNEQVRRVYGDNGISPTLNTMQGGNRQPKVLIPQATKKGHIECNVPGIADLSFLDSKTRRGRVQENGEIVPMLMAGQQDICYIDTPCIAASRGRNPENPSDRTTGSPTEQRLEINQNGTSNTITTVQKDNYVLEPIVCEQRTDEGLRFFKGGVCGALRTIDSCGDKRVLEPQVLTPKRTDYGKAIRKDYENGMVQESRHNMIEMQPREDGICNTLTTVQKDNYVAEPNNIKHTELPCIYDDRDKGFGIKTSDVCPTQRAERYGIKCVEPDFRIRKLTPLECWRLMGFTDEQFQKAQDAGVSNSQLYKQAGNSIVVDVLYYLFKNLFTDSPTKKTEPESELPGQMNILDYL